MFNKGWLLVSAGILVTWVKCLGAHMHPLFCRLHSGLYKSFLLVSCNPPMAPAHRPLYSGRGICDSFWPPCKFPQSSVWHRRTVLALCYHSPFQPYRHWNLPLKIAANSVSIACSSLLYTHIYLCVYIHKSKTKASIYMYYKLSFTEHSFSGRTYALYFLEITANTFQERISTNSHHVTASHHRYSCSNTFSGFLIPHCYSQNSTFQRLSSPHISFFPQILLHPLPDLWSLQSYAENNLPSFLPSNTLVFLQICWKLTFRSAVHHCFLL